MSSKIRTIGFYEPFGSLMLKGKIETRWVRKGKKPPFPLSHYLMYTTQKPCSSSKLIEWCGPEIADRIASILNPADLQNGASLCVGTLTEVRPMVKEDEELGFVKFIGEKEEFVNGFPVTKVQWVLVFKNVRPIASIKWKHGKQGVGILPDYLMPMIPSEFLQKS